MELADINRREILRYLGYKNQEADENVNRIGRLFHCCVYWSSASGASTDFERRHMVMDDIDRKILKLLQDNARVSLKTIAENTFLSSPAVSARIEKLEKDGVIAGYHAQVDPMKLGYHIIAFINLDVTPEDKPKFYAYAESIPNVLECNCVTGEYSMLLKVAFQSTMELDIFIGQLQKFGKTSTQIVFSTHVGPRGVDVEE